MDVIYKPIDGLELETGVKSISHEIHKLEYDVKSINRYSKRNSWNKRIAHHTKRKWGR